MGEGDVPNGPQTHSPPSSSPSQKNNLAMLYYGLVVVATAALVLAIYNLVIIKWCARRNTQRQRPPSNGGSTQTETSSPQSFQLSSRNLLQSSSFKYKKEVNDSRNNVNDNMGCGDYEHECSVCLSVFEEGEEVRQLPRCNHSFHAPCIDMWLHSHHDCPLCRAIVHIAPPPPPPQPPHRNIEMVGVL